MIEHTINLSVVIVTKNRVQDLSECLGSLLSGDCVPDEIVIVDNSSTDQTHALCRTLQKNSVIPIRYLIEKKTGYPIIYNRGLKEASFDWVAFIDDDCIAHQSWVKEIKRTISVSHEADVILGNTLPYITSNPYSLATHVFQSEWKMRHRRGRDIYDYEILDNKNIVYNRRFLNMHAIRYDEGRVTYLSGAAEDCDLGRQIQLASGKAIYAKSVLAYHKNAINFSGYWRRTIMSLAAYKLFGEKWPTVDRKKHRGNLVKFRSLVDTTIARYNCRGIITVRFVCIVYMTVLVSIVIDLLTRVPVARRVFILCSHKYMIMSQ